jgi:hypothetical protein
MFKGIRTRWGSNNPNGIDGDVVESSNNNNGSGARVGAGVGVAREDDSGRIIRAPNDHLGFEEEDGFVVAANSYVTSTSKTNLSISSIDGGDDEKHNDNGGGDMDDDGTSYMSYSDIPDDLPLLSNSSSGDSQDYSNAENYPPPSPLSDVEAQHECTTSRSTSTTPNKGSSNRMINNKYGSSVREVRNSRPKFGTALAEKSPNHQQLKKQQKQQQQRSTNLKQKEYQQVKNPTKAVSTTTAKTSAATASVAVPAVPSSSQSSYKNSPFVEYLSQIENDYGVTSVESVGPQQASINSTYRHEMMMSGGGEEEDDDLDVDVEMMIRPITTMTSTTITSPSIVAENHFNYDTVGVVVDDIVSLTTDNGAYDFSVQDIDPNAYEDDISTLGDESIRKARKTTIIPPPPPVVHHDDTISIGLSFLSPMTQQSMIQGRVEKNSSNINTKSTMKLTTTKSSNISPLKKMKKDQPPQKMLIHNKTNEMSIEPTRTRSTLIDSSFTMDENNIISPTSELDASILFFDGHHQHPNTTGGGDDYVDDHQDDKRTFPQKKNIHPENNDCHFEDENEGGNDTFIKRNKWTIIYFMVVLAIFLLVISGVALTFSFMYLKQEQEANGTDESSNSASASTTNSNNNAFNNPPTDTPFVATTTNVPTTQLPQPSPTMTPMKPSMRPATSTPPQTTSTRPSSSPSETTANPVSPSSSPVTAVVVQTDAPSNATNDGSEIDADLLSILAAYSPATVTAIGENFESSQYQAYDWLINDPDYWSYVVPTVVQRYALAVLFFSTGGPEWKNETTIILPPDTATTVAPAEVKTPWLSYTDECNWWTTNPGADGRACNSESIIISVHLVKMGLKGTIPPEIALLSNGLQTLFLSENDVTGTIPTELGELSVLKKFQASNNELQGTIPSELGRLIDLSIVGLGNNQLEGSLPSELGQLTNVKAMGLEKNFLEGSIPVQLCNMVGMGEY